MAVYDDWEYYGAVPPKPVHRGETPIDVPLVVVKPTPKSPKKLRLDKEDQADLDTWWADVIANNKKNKPPVEH